MAYELRLSPRAQSDFDKIKKAGNVPVLKKLKVIFEELMEHLLTGVGRPERLRHRENVYSRRLTQKDRVVYSVHEQLVVVDLLQLLGHYDDK